MTILPAVKAVPGPGSICLLRFCLFLHVCNFIVFVWYSALEFLCSSLFISSLLSWSHEGSQLALQASNLPCKILNGIRNDLSNVFTHAASFRLLPVFLGAQHQQEVWK